MSERIVVLDGYTLTPAEPGAAPPPGEPGWEAFEVLGELTVYDRTPDELIVQRARGASVLLTNKTPLTAETIGQLQSGAGGPGVKYIGVLATGVNVVDLAAAKRAGVVVTNVPGYSGDAVAQHVFALLLAMTNRVAEHDRAVHERRWDKCPDFSFTLGPIPVLTDKVLGIVGAGDIGRRVAKIGHALGMPVLVHSRTRRELDVPAEWVGLDELFKRSDVVSLHAPLTDETRHMVNADRLGLMKPSAYLVNTGRGPLLDEQAVADALAAGRLVGCAVDVLSSEPPAADNPLLSAPNCLITPHNAWAAVECRHRLMQIAADNLRAFMDGEPVNVVNG